jgi:hypothetical protein
MFFNELDNHPTACAYHPGRYGTPAAFESSHYSGGLVVRWSCCKKEDYHSPPCRVGQHRIDQQLVEALRRFEQERNSKKKKKEGDQEEEEERPSTFSAWDSQPNKKEEEEDVDLDEWINRYLQESTDGDGEEDLDKGWVLVDGGEGQEEEEEEEEEMERKASLLTRLRMLTRKKREMAQMQEMEMKTISEQKRESSEAESSTLPYSKVETKDDAEKSKKGNFDLEAAVEHFVYVTGCDENLARYYLNQTGDLMKAIQEFQKDVNNSNQKS